MAAEGIIVFGVNIILSIACIIVGVLLFWKTPKFNKHLGYHTKLATSNSDFYQFANKNFGKMIFILGIVTLTITIISSAVVFSVRDFYYLFFIVFALWAISFISIIIYIEIMLRKRQKIIGNF
ncbi:SdpI family protein [Mycoplasmopsis caviae]|uniref:SdpI family protein n=1 Tax=Mycoplasmopsis caviae TaxID=55603 RepID=A0A3P8LHN3_9BACT|nr:SdpI family protein [Mycoplasmopsis caviae]UUD35691.1 SdpI family protein [Mycoplasmopsis caviae]VDR41562.1 Uncharacterised protein [Mycoplasmopsis caviae]